MTERLLMGRKESNQTNKQTTKAKEEWPNGGKNRMSAPPTDKGEVEQAYNHITLMPSVLHKEARKRCKFEFLEIKKNIQGDIMGTR